MDAVHVVLSGEMLTTKVISIKDLFVASVVAIGGYKILLWLVNARQVLRATQTPRLAKRQRRQIKPRQSIAHIADTLQDIIENMVHSECVIRDKARYHSLLQTPLRESLQVLRTVSDELRHITYYESPAINHIQSTLTNDNCFNTKKQLVSTEQVIHDILPAIKDYAECEGITVDVIEVAHGYLKLSPGLAEKMLRELLLNAIKHNPRQTKITLTCSFTAQHAVFEVQDNGVGLIAKVVQQATGKYLSNDAVRSRRLSDSDIHVNLQTIATHLESVGGELQLSSARNWGTHLRLLIPAADMVARPLFAKYQKTSLPDLTASDPRKKILLVSRQVFVKHMLNQQFDNQFAIYSYGSFDKALLALYEIQPDIVIADFSWQHALGIQFCEFLRGCSLTSQIPFVMLTMAIEQSARVKMYASGVTAIVEKPLDPEEMQMVVENLIRNQAAFEDEVREAQVKYSIDSLVPEDNSKQGEFELSLKALIEQNYQDDDFNRYSASAFFHISEKTLHRRMSKHFDMSFSQYLRKFRLQRARLSLLAGHGVTEVSFDVGFNSTSYFGQCFKHEFGYPPSMLSKAAS